MPPFSYAGTAAFLRTGLEPSTMIMEAPDNQGTVYLVDDDPAVRGSVTELLRAHGLTVQAFGDAKSFLAQLSPDTAGCVLIDVRMPELSGLDVQQQIRERGASLPVIIMTGHGDVPMAVRAMKDGALEFVCKPFKSAELVGWVRKALDEDARRRREWATRREIERRIRRLNEGERAVLDALVEGRFNKVIADQLGISISTVEARRRRIRDKLQIDNLSVLIRMMDCYRKTIRPNRQGSVALHHE